jgi:hypothetical protein
MAHLILVIGPGHGHNELLSWTLNQSSFSANNYTLKWQLYPGEFGTFIRHDDAWNLQFDQCHRRLYKKLRNGVDSIIEKDHIEQLQESLHNSYQSFARVSHYLNCLNIDQAVIYAKSLEVPCSIANIDLPNSKHRSHYVQMEFSLGAAQSRKYDNDLSYCIQEVCYYLVKKHAFTEKIIQENKFDYVCNINNILSDDYQEFFFEMNLAMVDSGISNDVERQEYSSSTFENLQYFKFINQPIHPLMKQINEMSWQEIVDNAKQ